MLTGDAQATADHVAQTVGTTEVRANCLPIDKVSTVRDIPKRPVLMVGDGVNDSPVLASADIGIAMGARRATAASEAAAAVILVDDISRVVLAVEIGQDTVRIALQSIWLGIALGVGLTAVAAFGLIPATVGAGIQEVVDLATILNALRPCGSRTNRQTATDHVNSRRACLVVDDRCSQPIVRNPSNVEREVSGPNNSEASEIHKDVGATVRRCEMTSWPTPM